MLKSILIFGAGDNQLTLITAAKELGVKSIVIDPNPDAPGKALADVFEVVAPDDYKTTREIAQKYMIDGIVTSQMENPLRLMARLAAELGYIFPSPDVIERSRNKFLMKQAFIKHDIPCAKGILIKENEEIRAEKLQDFDYPLIIKPSDSHSSRGVYRVTNYNELLLHESETRRFSSDRSLLIEEFVEGPELSVEAITYKGKTTIIQYTEKIITHYPHTVELGHIQPAELTETDKESIFRFVDKAIRALGIKNSATHSELKLTEKGPVMIEIGARLGGDFISSYLTLASTGINMDEEAINIALGKEPVLIRKNEAYSFIKYLELPVGKRVIKVNNWKPLMNSEELVYASISIKEGEKVPLITDSAKRAGFIIVKGDSRQDVISRSSYYIRLLTKCIHLN